MLSGEETSEANDGTEAYVVCRTTLCGVRARLWRIIKQQSDKYRRELELLFSVVSCCGDRERDDTAERQCTVGAGHSKWNTLCNFGDTDGNNQWKHSELSIAGRLAGGQLHGNRHGKRYRYFRHVHGSNRRLHER